MMNPEGGVKVDAPIDRKGEADVDPQTEAETRRRISDIRAGIDKTPVVPEKSFYLRDGEIVELDPRTGEEKK